MKEAKRTKNLTLRDIHVGDWVQIWCNENGEYTRPFLVSNINLDGTVLLTESYEQGLRDSLYCNSDIETVDAIPITPAWLREFGFEVEMYKNVNGKIRYDGKGLAFLNRRYEVGRDCVGILFDKKTDEYVVRGMMYMHELIAYTEDTLDVKIQWEGGKR